jgi:hypothetical protein
MLLPGRVADDSREPIVEVRSTLNLETGRWIRNTGMHNFWLEYRLLYLAVTGLPVCDWLAGRACCSGGDADYRCTARKGPGGGGSECGVWYWQWSGALRKE